MSYILDALKKSEQERGHDSIPGVQTVHSSSLNYRSEKTSYWPYILITAVLLNIALVIYFIFDKDKPVIEQTAITKKAVTKSSPENKITASGAQATIAKDTTEQALITTLSSEEELKSDNLEQPPALTHISTSESERPAAETISTGRTSAPRKVAAENNIIDFYNLPESIKKQLPTITISAHVYSSNPLQRSIVINNNFMEEGEYVLDNLILHEITASGAIFNYHGTLFSYPVISSWQ